MPRATGIIWVGPIFDEGGYGSVSRNCLLGFRKINFPVRAVHLGNDSRDNLPPLLVKMLLEMVDTDVGSEPVGVMHFPPSYYPKIRFKGVSKKIGYTIFETDRIPPKWVKRCNELDEIWVPSKFNLETFSTSGVDKSKIKVLPYGVDTEFYSPTNEAIQIEGKRGFSFLYVFAFDWRKGFDLLLKAYYEEFSASDDVSLILKVFRPAYFCGKEDIKSLIFCSVSERFKKKDLPHTIIIDKRLSSEDIKKLYNTCDLYISTDRANGWGMPCMEAMAMGKPAATIDWSGSTEFMNEENSLLIRPTGNLVPVDERLIASRPFYRGHRWAEVKVEEVRRVLRFAYESRDALSKIAEKGRNEIIMNFSLGAIARKALDIISDVPERRKKGVNPSVSIKDTFEEKAKFLFNNLKILLGKR
jgi:glycosyltransferase involved in cell wall biosynthesis